MRGNFFNGMSQRVQLPWRESLRMCWSSVRNRVGRFGLIFLGISVVVAFLMSTYCFHAILAALSQSDDVHTIAVLERAGIFANDPAAAQKQTERKSLLMTLSCLLCFFGIVNTMLMSVTERTNEIGTLKCLGALDRFIVRLILIESLFIGFLGSLMGAAAGFALTMLQIGATFEFALLRFETWIGPLGRGLPMAVALGTLLTVLAAIYPTWVAARMEPVDAMRQEV